MLLSSYGGYNIDSLLRNHTLTQIRILCRKIRRRLAEKDRMSAWIVRYGSNADADNFTEFVDSLVSEENIGDVQSEHPLLDSNPHFINEVDP